VRRFINTMYNKYIMVKTTKGKKKNVDRDISKEMWDIINALDRYSKKHNDDVIVSVSLCAFEGKDCKVVDDRLIIYGDKKTLLVDNAETRKEIKKMDD